MKKGNTGDEFLVEKKNPLVLPPNFNELPEPGKAEISDQSNKSFEEKRYWRGPVWINCNWIIYQGLKNKDKKFAEIIRKKTINLYYSC